MARKLTVLFDRTWNTTKDRTNSVRLSKLIDTTSSDATSNCRRITTRASARTRSTGRVVPTNRGRLVH
jgi:hypothetical protein